VKDTAAVCDAAIVISRAGLRGFAPVNPERPNESVASGHGALFDDLESTDGNRAIGGLSSFVSAFAVAVSRRRRGCFASMELAANSELKTACG